MYSREGTQAHSQVLQKSLRLYTHVSARFDAHSSVLLAKHRADRLYNAIFTRANVVFQRRAVGNRHVERSNTTNRCLELVKAVLDDARGNFCRDTTTLMGFVDDDYATGFFYGRSSGSPGRRAPASSGRRLRR